MVAQAKSARTNPRWAAQQRRLGLGTVSGEEKEGENKERERETESAF